MMNKYHKVAEVYFEHAIESYESGDYHLFKGDTDFDDGCYVISLEMKDGAALYMKYSSLGPSVFILERDGKRMLMSTNSLPMPFLEKESSVMSITNRVLGWLK
jgi:hypothetical protein